MSISTQQKPIDSGIGRKLELTEVMESIDLSGKTAVVTGGYSGIGIETVRALTRAGATVLVPSRDMDRALKALEGIIPAEQIGFMDLSDLSTIARYGGTYRVLTRSSILPSSMQALWRAHWIAHSKA